MGFFKRYDFGAIKTFLGNVEAFRSLVQAGGNRLALDRDRLGVLHCAASHGHNEIIQAMLELSSGNIVNVKVCLCRAEKMIFHIFSTCFVHENSLFRTEMEILHFSLLLHMDTTTALNFYSTI